MIKRDSEGNQTFYVYGSGLIGQEENGVYRTYHYDRRGSTTAITDETGAVTDRFDYAPYGELVKRYGLTDTPFLYNGRDGVMTDNNGLYYMRARYYNLDLKRFINQDVLQGSINDGRSLNRYAYVNGNPISLTDPFGLSPNIDLKELGHLALDLLGMLPVVGGAFDLTNAYWYYKEGNYKEMCLSLVGFVPLVGSGIAATAKWGSKAFKASKIGSKVIGVGSKVLDFGKTIGKGIARGVSKGSDYVKRVLKSNAGSVKLGSVKGAGLLKKSRLGLSKEVINVSVGKSRDIRPMTIVREIKKGEKVKVILEEADELTLFYNLEHAVVKISDGRRVLVSGGADGIEFIKKDIRKIYFHTHPYFRNQKGPSPADFIIISKQKGLNQTSSHILQDGKLMKYWRKN